VQCLHHRCARRVTRKTLKLDKLHFSHFTNQKNLLVDSFAEFGKALARVKQAETCVVELAVRRSMAANSEGWA